MKGPTPKTLIGVVSLLAVLSVAVVDFGRTAPGEIHAAHARVESLAEADSCSLCHGGWTTSMSSACLECHETIQAHIDGHIGLHGILGEVAAAGCATCHAEHHGTTFQSVNNISFARAGIEDRLAFNHSAVGFEMGGKHLDAECSACHEHVDAEIVPEGAHRYIGLSQSCASCHEDVHEGQLSKTCSVCHTQSGFDEHMFTGHASFLPLTGGHASLDCRECHGEDSSHSLEVLRGPAAARPAARSCAACHDQPHQESFVTGAATSQGVALAASLSGLKANALCTGCHGPSHTSFAEDAEAMTATEHAASGFALALPHAELDCAACHTPGVPYGERYPGREAEQCISCHQDPHAGQFAGLAFGTIGDLPGGAVNDKGCLVCHAPTHFTPHAFGTDAHAQTALPLEGAHEDADCASCHGNLTLGDLEVRQFHGVSSQCDQCHGDAHSGFFDEQLSAHGESPEHGDCALCHGPSAFSPANEFDHEFWTSYALEGSHASAECTSCHAPSAEPDANGRTFGVIHALYGEVTGCNTCHGDVHEGRFDAKGLPAKVDGREDCARCHSPVSFREQPHGFDHGKWTGWRLDGAHAQADCTSCHKPLRRPDGAGRTWGRAKGTDCASCHESPHGDQFDTPRKKACVKCHESPVSFGILSFDHNLESRFPLDEAHQKVECAGCHTAAETEESIRYRPLPMDCVDCHGVHEKALRRRRRR